jgi:sulfoxide reductase heme-binding subunit YedZ
MSAKSITALRVALFLACLLPLAALAVGLWQDTLGANPIEYLIRSLGDWALRLLLATLAITPLRRFTGWHWLLKLRRMLGLYAFFYAVLHVTGYVWVDQFFDWVAIARDILKRPFITVGMLTLLLMLPLAITSSQAMMRRLGGKRWQGLHRLVYVVGICAVIHFWWMVKLDLTQPALHGVLLALLLGARLLPLRQPVRSVTPAG